MILKILLVIAVVGIVYFIFIKKKPSSTIHKKHKQRDASEMVECEECGIFVELDETLLSNAKYYCSKECLGKVK